MNGKSNPTATAMAKSRLPIAIMPDNIMGAMNRMAAAFFRPRRSRDAAGTQNRASIIAAKIAGKR